MSSLRVVEKTVFEKLFDRGGYVLNFNDRIFKEYFNEYGIDIENQKYRRNGASKMTGNIFSGSSSKAACNVWVCL